MGESNEYKEIFSRNIGIIDEIAQKKISISTIGVAGTGADGGLALERIIRLGVKKVKISDPEVFDMSNINRQFGATPDSVGKNKCLAVAEEIKKIRPDLEVETFPEGINESNADQFVEGCHVVLDEIEYTTPKASIYLHRAARERGIEVFAGLNLGFGVNIFRFTPSAPSFEQLVNFDEKKDEKNFRMESLVPNIPDYISKEVVKKVMKREMYVPTISPTIAILAGYLSYFVLGTIIGIKTIPAVPSFFHMDMMTSKNEIKNF